MADQLINPTILVDTAEPGPPHPWVPYFSCETYVQHIPTGDFSLPGCEDWVAIERKTLDDLIGCLIDKPKTNSPRARFTRELQRAQRIKDFVVVCEGSYSDLLRGNYYSKMTPNSAWESIIALQQRFGIPFLMAGSVPVAARLCESILLRWYREHVKIMDEVRKAQKRLECSAGAA